MYGDRTQPMPTFIAEWARPRNLTMNKASCDLPVYRMLQSLEVPERHLPYHTQYKNRVQSEPEQGYFVGGSLAEARKSGGPCASDPLATLTL